MLVPVPSQLGYPVLALLIFGESAGLPLPGETALLTAGGLAAAGHLALPVVIAVAATAAILGDTLGYWLGRRGGRAFLTRDGLAAAHRRRALAHADRFFARCGAATVFFGRWIPGVRVVVAVTAGAARMPWPRFALANALGAIAWAGSVSTLAAAAGPAGALALAAAGLGLGAVTLTGAWLRRRRRGAPGARGSRTAAAAQREPWVGIEGAQPAFGEQRSQTLVERQEATSQVTAPRKVAVHAVLDNGRRIVRQLEGRDA